MFFRNNFRIRKQSLIQREKHFKYSIDPCALDNIQNIRKAFVNFEDCSHLILCNM